MLELRHNKENGGEFLPKEQIVRQLSIHKYIVVGMFCRDDDFGGESTAPVLYKGDSETEAKKVWKDKAMQEAVNAWLDYKDGGFSSCYIFNPSQVNKAG